MLKQRDKLVIITKVRVSKGLEGVVLWPLPFLVLLENWLRGLVGCRGDTFWLSLLLDLLRCVFWSRLPLKRIITLDRLETLTLLEIRNYPPIIATYLTSGRAGTVVSLKLLPVIGSSYQLRAI